MPHLIQKNSIQNKYSYRGQDLAKHAGHKMSNLFENGSKRNVTTLNSAAHIKQKCCVAYVAGKNDKRALYIASSESYQPNRNLFGLGRKLKESILCHHPPPSATIHHPPSSTIIHRHPPPTTTNSY